jgi:hypothetical protein
MLATVAHGSRLLSEGSLISDLTAFESEELVAAGLAVKGSVVKAKPEPGAKAKG